MNPLDWLILGLIALALFFALRHIWKGRGQGCGGGCSDCGKACPHRRK